MKMRGVILRMVSKLLFLRGREFDISYVSLRSQLGCPAQTVPEQIRAHSYSDEYFVTPEGCFPVDVGKERKRYFVGISYLNRSDWGPQDPLRCDVESFEHVLWLIHSDPDSYYGYGWKISC